MSPVVAVELLLGAATHLGLAYALYRWARGVARERGGAYRYTVWLPVAALLVTAVGLLATGVYLHGAFSALEGPPSERNAMLADNLARAQIATASGIGLSAALYLASAISSLTGTIRARRSA